MARPSIFRGGGSGAIVYSTTAQSTGQANAAGSADTVSRGDHVHRTLLGVRGDGLDVGARPNLDFYAGDSIDIAVIDDDPSDSVQVTVTWNPGKGGLPHTDLADLQWAGGGHFGDAGTIAGFDGFGFAIYFEIGTTAGTLAAGDDSRIVGAQPTSQKNAANGYAGLDANTLLNAAQLPRPTTTQRGAMPSGTQPNQLNSGWGLTQYRGLSTHSHNLGTLALAIGAINWAPTNGIGGKISNIQVEVTTLAAGAVFDVGIYSINPTLGTCVLLWSATGVSAATTGMKLISIASGAFTVAGASYNDGAGNFVVPNGETLAFGVLARVASPTFRAYASGQGVVWTAIVTGGASASGNTVYTRTGLGALPSDLTGAAVGTVAGIAVWVQEVST